ncbi:MAG: hypothetical protein U1F76_20750 [Candidatus Competibacteraceae bacterium]
MNARTQDVNLLKVALLPASLLATVVLALSVMATTIGNAVTVDPMTTAQIASQTSTTVAHTPIGLRAGSGG